MKTTFNGNRFKENTEHTPRFATRIFVKGPPWPADFLLIVWMEWTGVPGALGEAANIAASLGGCKVDVGVAMVVVKVEVQFEPK